MGRRKKPLIKDLEITGIAAEGKAIGYYNDMVVFVPWLVPGDVADVQIKRKRKKYMEGSFVEIHKYSDLRIDPFCEHFFVCGGCKWQHLPYQYQLDFKQKQVEDNLSRIGKIALKHIKPIKASEKTTHYRNKMEYAFSSTRWLTKDEIAKEDDVVDRNALGFHVPGRFDRVLDLKKCHLQDDFSNQIRLAVKEFAEKEGFTFYNHREFTGLLRNLVVRNTSLGEWMVIVVFGEDNQQEIDSMMCFIRDTFPQITSLQYIINQKVNDVYSDLPVIPFSGRDHIFEQMEGLQFKIGPVSFFQTNSSQALELYKTARDFADLKGDEVVYDLYTGTGTIANFVARFCKKVVGVEFVEAAIYDAKNNSEANNIKNTSFFAGDMSKILTYDFVAANGKPDVVITDPPRAGMADDVLEILLRALPQRIVYISCNPATQARDLSVLSAKYEVKDIQPVDMFPHTHHVENVVKLELK
ncbi:MAG: 23S rRNA (uracil(1939)-C(5))-methyltransferase RlmD [Bacteroidales bacterium]|nr:23S rRNA (uracil(1939)-C(5))-methyltransferase RlmD [Bacteroidales bacterium]MBN2819259.1 23S rRNA (uracil(1939)-C(5))-methyltransferase RlmD [Bacteroidales bacterium]